jgi:peptidoglycan/xylan/chitin deacetylase (PgdA/CDA1 family)
MNLTRREFLKLGGAAVVSLSITRYTGANAISVPVLMFHDISHLSNDPETVSPPLFASQMEWLYGAGYRAIAFSDVNLLDAESAQRAVIITFDDGYVSFMDYAFPLFQNYGFKSTINIIGEHVGGFVAGNDPRISWDECRFLVKSGLVEIGCHTYGLHSWYGRKARSKAVDEFNEKLRQDLTVFQDVITRELGRPAKTLAWPYGMHNKRSIEIAKQAGFSFILNSENGYFVQGGDRYDIPRLTVGHTIDLQRFREHLEMKP